MQSIGTKKIWGHHRVTLTIYFTMDVDSRAAKLLLDSEERLDMSDTDDCESDDEEILQNIQRQTQKSMKVILETKSKCNQNGEDEKDDYHKMTTIENRRYQNELLDLAKDRNIIICLPTGSGKTYIALKLAEHMLPSAIEKQQKIVFLANNVPLVNQQAKYFSQNLVSTSVKDDQVVRAVTGDLNVDIWKQEQWDEVFRSCHILVISTQIVLDALRIGYIKWAQIALLILDECHHAQKNHPMAELMKNYGERLRTNKSMHELPKVLGLTATIIKGQSKAEQIEKDIEDIEQLLCCKAVTHIYYEEVLRKGWTVLLVRTPSITTASTAENPLKAFFETGQVPENVEVLYQSPPESESSSNDFRCSTNTIVQMRVYTNNYTLNDPVCTEVNQLIELLDLLPSDFGTDEEISVIERINHPTLTSEEQIYNKNKGAPKALKSFLTDLLKTYKELGPYCCKLATIIKILYLIKWINELDNADDEGENENESCGDIEEGETSILQLVELTKTVLFQFMNKLDQMMALAAAEGTKNEPSISAEAWTIRNCVSNKVTLLWNILQEKLQTEHSDDEANRLCGLIFCERRITAQVLRFYIEEAARHWPTELGFVKPEVMVGHSTIIGDTELARFTAKRQSKIVQQFHNGDLNLLVATQVVEEGLNVPACNLVIRLDSINSYPSFVQSQGRARKKDAICYALIDQDNVVKETSKIESYVKYNRKLSEALKKNALHVGEIDEEIVVGRHPKPIPPFNPSGNPDGPEITATDSISLVHRYCNSLSCDKIAGLFPTAWKEERIGDDKRKYFKARVLLPIMSPVREAIEGEWMPDKTLAKRSAYLQCCKRLYEEGELNENLLPKPRSIDGLKCDFLDKLMELHNEEKETAKGKIGTRKRTQLYRKKIPVAFNPCNARNSSMIETNQLVAIYRVKIKLTNFVGSESVRNLYEFGKLGLSYGVMTHENLQDLPRFSLKANYGTLEVSLKKFNHKGLSLDQIESLQNFQIYLRNDIYGAQNSVLKPDLNRSIFTVPLSRVPFTNRHEIDWQLIQCLLNLDKNDHLFSTPSDQSRKEMKFLTENYHDKVLIPWYKDDITEKPELLCSLSVLAGTNAKSEFDDTTKFTTFEEYFGKKYGVQLFHPEYPLIQCKPIAKQLNFLTNKVDAYEMRKELQLKSHVKMVPELLNFHMLPASLYVQGKFLPSILHRIWRLLVAKELRQKVASYFEWEVDKDWEPDLSDNDEDEDDGDSGDELGNTLEEAMKNLEVEVLPSISDNDKTKDEQKRKKQGKMFLMETVNPLTVDWEYWGDVMETKDSSDRQCKKIRDTKFAFPEPPTRNSNVCGNLVDIDKVESYNFDKETDFLVVPGPTIETVMEALTLSNAQDSIDLEKLEVMGDSVLKLIVSLHVFRSFPRWDEGKMTQMRMRLISNLHLYQLGKNHQVGELLSGSIFIPNKSWLPCGFHIPIHLENLVLSKGWDYGDLKSLPESVLENINILESHLVEMSSLMDTRRKATMDENVPHTTYTHSSLGDKSIADCMEAIIGAYYVHGGIDGAFRIMDYLGLRGPLDDGSVTTYSRQSTMTPFEESEGSFPKIQKIIPFLKDLEETLCYRFKNPWVAVEALTHPTFMGNRVTPCYERLEYVGDAILDFLVTNYIVKITNMSDPGKITDLRAALVNNITFGTLAVRYGFHKFLKYDSEQLRNFIIQFETYQEENDHIVGDPCKLVSDFECPTVREIEVPKVLGDVFESIAGAVYVDSGMSIDTVWKVFYRLMKNEMEEFAKNIPKSPLRELYEQFPGKVKFCKLSEESHNANPKSKHHIQSKYQTVFLKVPNCDTFVRGVGTTIKQAKQAAAKYVVRKMKYPDTGK